MKVIIAITFLFLHCYGIANDHETTLELVQIFFRHGDRTPRKDEMYPTDSYGDHDFPEGYGELTKQGKQRSYRLGKLLHARYENFLGPKYRPEMVYMRTTDLDRTKVSALLVLAALFPPSSSDIWDEHLHWNPIPYSYIKLSEDYMLMHLIGFCPAFLKEMEKVLNSDAVLELLNENTLELEYLSNYTGKPIKTLRNVVDVYQRLTAEESMNLPLNEWTDRVYPDFLHKLAAYQFFYENSSPLLKRINGGRMIKMVIEEMVKKAEGKLKPEGRKIYLYSSHDTNIVSLLSTLHVYIPHIPKYSSAIIFELHRQRTTNKFFVRVLYLRNHETPPEEQILPNCDALCPLQEFLHLTEPYIPVNFTQECEAEIVLD